MIVMVIIRVKRKVNIMEMIMKMKVKIIMVMIMVIVRVKIMYINVLMRLVSIAPGHVKLDWLPPPKVDRVNDNNSENNNE